MQLRNVEGLSSFITEDSVISETEWDDEMDTCSSGISDSSLHAPAGYVCKWVKVGTVT